MEGQGSGHYLIDLDLYHVHHHLARHLPDEDEGHQPCRGVQVDLHLEDDVDVRPHLLYLSVDHDQETITEDKGVVVIERGDHLHMIHTMIEEAIHALTL